MYYLSTFCLVLFFLFSLFHPLLCASSKPELNWCQAQFQCGNITAGFPFWGGDRHKDCGLPLMELYCDKSSSSTSISISNQEYHVLHINQTSNSLTVARPSPRDSCCSYDIPNTNLPPGIFELLPTYKTVYFFYRCSFTNETCPEIYVQSVSEDPGYQEDYGRQSFTMNVPTSFVTNDKNLNMTNMESVLKKGFEVEVKTDEKAHQAYHHRLCSSPFNCGNQGRLFYPFWIPGREECGHPDFKLNCSGGFAELSISTVEFRILMANFDSGVIRLARRSDFINNTCPEYPLNAPFNENVLPFAPDTELLTIYYYCRQQFTPPVSTYVGALGCEDGIHFYVTKSLSSPLLQGFLNNFTGSCDRNVSIPASGPALITLQRSPNPKNLKMAIEQGFELEVNSDCRECVNSGGACGYNQTSSVFGCYCKDGTYKRNCGDKAVEPHRLCNAPFRCGNQVGLFYPFWIPGREDCGHPDFRLNCSGRFAELSISSVKYRIVEATYVSRIIRLARSEYIGNLCPQDPLDVPFDETVLPFALNTELLTIYYDCGTDISLSVSTYVGDLDCRQNDDIRNYYVTRNLSSPLLQGISTLLNNFRRICRRNVSIPASRPKMNTLERTPSIDNLRKALEEGFELGVNQECSMCIDTGGACGYNKTSNSFVCYCNDGSENYTCGSRNKDAGLFSGAKAGIGAASALVGLILAAGACLFCCQKKTSDDLRQQDLKALIPLKHYSYAQIERITKSFAEVVGKGGFGTVYKGTLPDGCSVAVKILKDSKDNREDFINEVASMSKTSHVNIVSLLGFCSEGSKRAIIYEFLENGSLGQFISNNTSMNMDWMALYGIALGVARGLEYLHHGCKTRIVHFDIKPENVLLDDNLCPKVSDFGLAKLCEKKESTLSLLNTRGTIGYIAPEVFSRMFGRVSHKSDVYSYGMLLLEMIGARNRERAQQNSASNPSSMYFPEWIYKDLEKGDTGRLIENGISSEDEEVAKKMTLVGLWCIQSYPSDRPAMNRVVEMMEGNLDALEVPPRPVLQIPQAPLQESSTLSEDIQITHKYNL